MYEIMDIISIPKGYTYFFTKKLKSVLILLNIKFLIGWLLMYQ